MGLAVTGQIKPQERVQSHAKKQGGLMPRRQEAEEVEEGQRCCYGCGEIHDEDDMREVDGDWYCQDCFNEDYSICERCDSVVSNDDLVCPDNGGVYCCDDCAEADGHYRCNDCNSWINSRRDGRYNDDEGNTICIRCYENNYGTCYSCEETFHNDDLTYDEDEGEYYCDSCNSRQATERVIKQYSFKPSKYLYKKLAWENTVYMGIELEVECYESADRVEKAKEVQEWLASKNLQDLVYIKDDGSLDNGFEIVFHPMTLQYIHKSFPMKAFLEFLKSINLTSHDSGHCGLHVHLSRKRMSDRHIYNGKLFFYKCQSFLKKLSRRAGKYDYCKFDSQIPTHPFEQEAGRYSAFNSCASTNTVEVRIFRGTLKYKSFISTLQFCDCFAGYIQETSTVYLTRKSSSADIWHGFIDYAKRKNRYSQFVKYVLTEAII